MACRGAWWSGGISVASKALFLAKLTWYPWIEVDLGVVVKRRVGPLLWDSQTRSASNFTL